MMAADAPPKALPYLDQSSQTYPEAQEIAGAIRDAVAEEPAYQYARSGQALAAINQWSLAAYAFEKAVFLRQDYQEAWIYWGEALQHVEDPNEDPLQVLETGLALDEDSPLANLFLGLYWQRQGSHLTALVHFELVETLWPDNPDVLVESGKSLAASGDLQTALEKYQAAVELAPLEGTYYIQLAEFCILYNYQVKEVGLPAGRVAVQLKPEDPGSLDLLGQVLLALEDELNAVKLFQDALEIDPEYAPALFHLGIYYSAHDDADAAIYYLEQALVFSENPSLSDQVERLMASYS
jgi:tetratricopeptide (TPR) repeat protein